LEVSFTIILPSMPRSSKWCLSLKLPYKNSACTSPHIHTYYLPCPSYSSFNRSCLVRSTDDDAPYFAVLSFFLLPHPSQAQICSSAPYFKCLQLSSTHNVRDQFSCPPL
jgi:hypothetical protein